MPTPGMMARGFGGPSIANDMPRSSRTDHTGGGPLGDKQVRREALDVGQNARRSDTASNYRKDGIGRSVNRGQPREEFFVVRRSVEHGESPLRCGNAHGMLAVTPHGLEAEDVAYDAAVRVEPQ